MNNKPTVWGLWKHWTFFRPIGFYTRLPAFQVEEVLCYPSSENKGADQLFSNLDSDMQICGYAVMVIMYIKGDKYKTRHCIIL